MILGLVGVIWLAMVTGFGIDIVKRAQNGGVHFPLIIHLHAVAYLAWLALLVLQVWLVRTRRIRWHRRAGLWAIVLLPMMLVLGPAAAISDVAGNPYMPDRWIAWLSVQFTNTIGCVVLLTLGLLARRHASAHKRLMLMGTIAVMEPGFGRIWEAPLVARWGEGYLSFFVSTYIGTWALMAAVGAYDFATRRRLHPVYIYACLWIFANEAVAGWLFYEPFWLGWMKTLTNHAT